VESSDSPIFRGPFDLSCSLGGSQLEQELNHLKQFPFYHRSVEEEIGASGDARGAFQGKVTRHEKYDGQFPMGNRDPDGTAKVKPIHFAPQTDIDDEKTYGFCVQEGQGSLRIGGRE
jgi:hypothetical protein